MNTQDDFARRLTTRLDESLAQLDAGTLHRLASSRRQAVSASATRISGHGVLALLHRHALLSAVLLAALLLAGGWLMHNTPRPYSPETDIQLLTGDLPPHAYADNTFSQWLNSRANF